MNYKHIFLNTLTSVTMMTAVVFSLNACGHQYSGAIQTEKNNNMSESTQKAKDPVLAWFNEKPWFKGVKLTPSPSINLDELKKYYAANPAYFEKAFEYFKNNDIAKLPVGKYLVDGENVFAAVSEYDTQETADRKWENHKKYIDIQILLSGKEMMSKASYADATPDVPYNEAKDIEFRKATNGKTYLAEPGMFFMFFPSESHMPNQKAGEIMKVKKVVFKIKTS
jgi:biofilm protein TabA